MPTIYCSSLPRHRGAQLRTAVGGVILVPRCSGGTTCFASTTNYAFYDEYESEPEYAGGTRVQHLRRTMLSSKVANNAANSDSRTRRAMP